MEDRLLARKTASDVVAPETVNEYTEEQIKEIHENTAKL